MRKLLIAFLLCASAFAACSGSSPNLTAASVSLTDVSACNTLAISGDTITIPAGSSTWSGDLTITKAIRLHGSGSGGTTIVTSGGVIFSPSAGEETKTFEMDGIDFEGNRTHFNETGWGHSPSITGLKIHDNAFNGVSGGRAIWLAGREFGVFYLNTFSGNFIDVSVIGAGVSNGNFFACTPGSANYPYFEDNTIGNGVGGEFVSETGQGGRMVWRHNTVNGYNSGAGSEFHDIHGEQGSGGWTACSEYYHNLTINTGSTPFRWMNNRGGTMYAMNNTTDKGSLAFEMTEYQSWGGNGICNTYPIAYNSSENYCSPISGSCLETQVHASFYFNNLFNGSNKNPSLGNATGGSCGSDPPFGDNNYIQQNREYWLPSSGLESALPGTCVAGANTFYGTTDTDKIFQCTSTNVWTNVYTPYPYPHPLRGGITIAAPSAPMFAKLTPQ